MLMVRPFIYMEDMPSHADSQLMGNPDLRHSAGQSGEPQKGVSVFSVDVISKIGEH
jgi:hypothetical protein